MEPAVAAALVAACASLAATVVSIFLARKAQEQARRNQLELQRYQRDLKTLEAKLGEQRAEKDARRDYEYEALKRLYHECSPLLFQLAEQATQLQERIEGVAQAASEGDLDGARSWLAHSDDRYYLRNTEYRLLAPLATVKLLQRRLTHLDLSLDTDLRVAYSIARQAIRSLTDEFKIARMGASALEYDPHNARADDLEVNQPAIYWHQGIPRGILENAVESLIMREPEDGGRVMTFLEFESAMDDPKSSLHAALARIRYLFADFHPGHRPVLWRVLLVNASLYRAIRLWAERDRSEATWPDMSQLLHIPVADRRSFDWRAGKDGQAMGESVDAAFAAADAYVSQTIEKELEGIIRATHEASEHAVA